MTTANQPLVIDRYVIKMKEAIRRPGNCETKGKSGTEIWTYVFIKQQSVLSQLSKGDFILTLVRAILGSREKLFVNTSSAAFGLASILVHKIRQKTQGKSFK